MKTSKISKIKIKLKKNENMGMNYSLIIKDYKSIDSELDSNKDQNEVNSYVSDEGTKQQINQMIKCKVKFNSIGISFIDHTPKEICYIFLKNIEFSLNKLKSTYLKLKLRIGSLQIDNCLEEAYYQNVMNIGSMNEKTTNIRFVIDLNYNNLGNSFFINKCGIEVNSKIFIMVDGLFISEMYNFFKNFKKIVSKDNLVTLSNYS